MSLDRLANGVSLSLGCEVNTLQIWQIADTENRGFLTPSGFGVVLRLIGHAQAGRPVTAQIATQRMHRWFL